MPNIYRSSPLPAFPAPTLTSAGYTQRMQTPVGPMSYSGQRVLTTYMSVVMVVQVQGAGMSDVTDSNPRTDIGKIVPYQLYHLFTTSFSSPDGGLPYQHGDYFIPNGNILGLVANTAHPIRGFMPYPTHWELVIERKL